jgi:hypothetical protein
MNRLNRLYEERFELLDKLEAMDDKHTMEAYLLMAEIKIVNDKIYECLEVGEQTDLPGFM